MSYKTLHTGKKIQSFDLSNEFKNRFKKKTFKIFVNGKHIRGKKECEGGGVRIKNIMNTPSKKSKQVTSQFGEPDWKEKT